MGETIKLKSADGFSFSAYVAGPANATKGVVVVQEIFGVNHHIRDMADRFAALDYAVVAPAVYDRAEPGFEVGYTPEDIAKGRDVRMKLSDADLMKDIEAAANHLSGKKLGIVGYCFGGTVAWWGATRLQQVRGGVLLVRRRHSRHRRMRRPNCPVQMHFGEKDASIPMTDVDAVRAAQPKVEVYVYEGAQHGFGCNERGSFSKPDYELAQKRTVDFFAKNLA